MSRLQIAKSLMIPLLVFVSACSGGQARSDDIPSISTDAKVCSYSSNSRYSIYLKIGYPNNLGCGFAINQGKASLYSAGGEGSYVEIIRAVKAIDFKSSGFNLSMDGKWSFVGSSYYLDAKFKARHLNKVVDDDSTMLIGYQLVSMHAPNGDHFLIYGIRILRITPTFAVATHFNFAPHTPKDVRDAITQDLIHIVNSVEPAHASSTSTAISH